MSIQISEQDRLIKQFHEAIKDADLARIDECIEKGLMTDQSYSYSYREYNQFRGRYQTTYKDFTPLIYAVETQNIEVVQHLLKHGAAVLIKSGGTPLSIAAAWGNLEMVKLLLENGAEPSMQTALLAAIENRKLDIVQYLVEKGVYINWKYKNGSTPLSKSLTIKCEEIAKFLIDNGADMNQVDNRTLQTAFFDAIEKRSLNFVQYLVEKGVGVNWRDENGNTPLSKSITVRCGKISTFLVDNGASLEELINGSTPLILSVERQVLDVLKYLIQKGANINQIDNEGRTALSVAASKKYLPFTTCLIESGADIHLAQKEVDEYAETDEDFDIFLKLFKIKQLKLNNFNGEEVASVTLLEKQAGSGQEEASPPSDQEKASPPLPK